MNKEKQAGKFHLDNDLSRLLDEKDRKQKERKK